MANYRFIQDVEDARVFNDGDNYVMEPRDVFGKVEYADGREEDSREFAEGDYHAYGRSDWREAEAADYNG